MAVSTRMSDAETPIALPVIDEHIRQALGSRYTILEFLGSGASAVVFRVADTTAGDEIRAVKVTNLDSSDAEPERLEALRGEFRLASRFDHPNLVRYHSLEILPRTKLAFTAMELVEGVPLGYSLTGGDVAVTSQLVIELLRGLHYLHDSGFVHGDIKPSNVLCRIGQRECSVKLLDYHLTFQPIESTSNVSRGTLRYMAPEMISGRGAGPSSDLYSVGVLFYEALTGEVLFGGTPSEIVSQHLTAPMGELKLGDESRKQGLLHVLNRLLSKHPAARYHSAAEAIREIAQAVGCSELPETRKSLMGRVRSVPLVGRDHELDAFRKRCALSPAPDLPERLFLIKGRAGLGKSRLLRDCEILAQALGNRTLRLSSRMDGSAIAAAIEQFAGAFDPEVVSHDGHTRKPQYDGMSRSTGITAGDSLNRQYELLDADVISRLDRAADHLMHVCADVKIILFMDDFHLLRPEGLQALSFLVRALARGDVVFCFTLLQDDDSEQRVQSQLCVWEDERVIHQVELDELDSAARRELIAAKLPSATPASVLDRLSECFGGSPLIINTTIEHLVFSGRITVDAQCNVVVSEDVYETAADDIQRMGSRLLESVDEALREVFNLLAAAGREVALSILAAATSFEQRQLQDAMKSGPASGLVSLRLADGETLCRFQHASFAGALQELQSPERLNVLHDRLADTLSLSSNAGDTLVAIRTAWHRLQGATPDKGVALALKTLEVCDDLHGEAFDLAQLALENAGGVEKRQLLETAGRMNIDRGAFSEAVPYLQEALDSERLSPSNQVRLLRMLASAYSATGAHAEVQACVERALSLQKEDSQPDPAETARLKFALAKSHSFQARFDLALENFDQVVKIAEEIGNQQLQAVGLLWLGNTYLHTGDPKKAVPLLLRSFWRFRDARDTVGIGRVLAVLGHAAIQRSNWARAEGFLRRAVGCLRQKGLLSEAAWALNALGAVHHKRCEWECAREHYENARDLYERLGDARGRSGLLLNLSHVNARLGSLESAISQVREALGHAPDDPDLRCHILRRIASCLYLLGDLPSATDVGHQLLGLASEHNLSDSRESAHRTLGEIKTLTGQCPEAEEHLHTALALSEKANSNDRQAICNARRAELAIARGDITAALRLTDEACAKANLTTVLTVKGTTYAVRGKALLTAKNLPDALSDLLEAEKMFAETKVWDELADVALHLGKVHMAMGQYRFATHYLQKAVDLVEHVSNQLTNERNRHIFLSDPRRAELFSTVRELRRRVGH